MFIGGLNWETTDESLKEYFSQFGEVVECTVMRDGPTGRSRGFGFLTFKDPKTVNIVMVKEHYLDGKIIDPKRAIPRDEQEKTSKIFVGGVSQDATESDFREYFTQFGRVLDATLMMDKDTGRPRGFGFVTFDSEAAVENALNHPNLEILGKAIEVKKAQPRGKTFDDRESGFRDRGHHNRNDNRDNYNQHNQQNQMAPGSAAYNGMTPQLMAQYWQNMQRYMAAMQQQMGRGGPMPAFNPTMMNPAMIQQMQMQMQMMRAQQMQQGAQAGGAGGFQGGYGQQQQQQGGYDAQQQQNPQQAGAGGYGAQQQQRGFQSHPSQRDYQPPQAHASSWEGMYDEAPAQQQPSQQAQPAQAQQQPHHTVGPIRTGTPTYTRNEGPPPNAPTGPKNARPGAFRGAGRGGPGIGGPRGGPAGFRGGGGYHPYARSGH
ncbi:RNA-binding domain-containing protein [Ascodesmis nigricans]|uniref:RNA-binding domain-containing protein n=1 Tax=Ascodesmis nigricans TaxID=341454 RepID=A0A4S2N8A8_9PEZI|nr:RNA-binding domain-containing protein [Ascodesmis nigricans]